MERKFSCAINEEVHKVAYGRRNNGPKFMGEAKARSRTAGSGDSMTASEEGTRAKVNSDRTF